MRHDSESLLETAIHAIRRWNRPTQISTSAKRVADRLGHRLDTQLEPLSLLYDRELRDVHLQVRIVPELCLMLVHF